MRSRATAQLTAAEAIAADACETSPPRWPTAALRSPRIASYEADPEEVGRVLLLYSGGLDTSVMLRWIQETYGAEIVTL